MTAPRRMTRFRSSGDRLRPMLQSRFPSMPGTIAAPQVLTSASLRRLAMDLSIIVVTHNTREMTIECIRSILEQTTRVRYELIVFDSGSTDGSSEAISERFPSVKLMTSPRDLGFGKANNIAAKGAEGTRLLLINPDTVVLDHAIDRLNDFADMTPECRIWGGRTVFADGSLNPASCWKFATLWSVFCWAVGLNLFKGSVVFNSEAYPDWKRDSVRSVDIVSGCFFLI